MPSVLFVSDLQLGFRGLNLVRHYYPYATPIIWNKGDVEGRKKAHQLILSRDWDITLSFFNDLIFKADELAKMRVPLNIHPASPALPGVAYDTIPLIRNHRTYGATLHQMTPNIDKGKIYDVLEAETKPKTNYLDFRAAVHRLSLDLLAKTLRTLDAYDSLELLEAHLALQADQCSHVWSEDYWSYSRVINCLDELWKEKPSHRVFTNHPKYQSPVHQYKFAPHDRRESNRYVTPIGEQLNRLKEDRWGAPQLVKE